MSKRLQLVVKGACAILAALLVFQVVRVVLANDPLAGQSWSLPTTGQGREASAAEESRTPPGRPPSLPAGVQARVETIKESEIFGPVPRPLPMALLGIAGPDAMIRTPNGQTGLLRENEELGGVKLLAIGTNRVLIEHEGQKKELTLFSGYGSDSLLPKEQAK